MLISAISDIWVIFKEYTNEALLFAMAFILIYFVIFATDSVLRIIRHKKMRSIGYVLVKTCLFALFGIYMSYILAITLSGREIMQQSVVKNLDPFSTLWRRGELNIEIFENFLMFVPLGVLLPCVFKYLRGFIRTSLAGFVMSVLIEVAQIILKRGVFDVDDIIFNTLGSVVGYIVFAGFYDGLLGIKRRIITEASHKLKRKPPLGKLYDRFALRHGIVLFGVQIFPGFIWANVVMGFSSNNGDESGFLSKGLLNVLYSIITSGEQITKDVLYQSEDFLFYEMILRKMAHVFEYGVLAILIWAAFYSIRWVNNIVTYGIGLAGAFVVGMMDETNQMSVIGRSGTYVDVLIDMTGSVAALLITFVIIKLSTRYYINKHS